MRAAQARSVLQIHLAAMPHLEERVAHLIDSHERYLAKLANGDKPRRCRARRTDGQLCDVGQYAAGTCVACMAVRRRKCVLRRTSGRGRRVRLA
jgi:hypothetical protein